MNAVYFDSKGVNRRVYALGGLFTSLKKITLRIDLRGNYEHVCNLMCITLG